MLMIAQSSHNYTEVLETDPILNSKEVLILPADPKTPSPAFVDDTFNTSWSSNNKNLTAESDGNTLNLSFKNNGNASALLSYERQLPQINTNDSRIVTWRLLVNSMSSTDYAGIMLYDDEANNWFWVGAISLNNSAYTNVQQGSWVDVTFDMQNNQWHNFTSATKMRIVLRVSSSSFENILSDNVSFSGVANSQYSPDLTPRLLQWLKEGGRLIVVNSDGLGDFSSLLTLKKSVSNFTASNIKSNSTSIPISPIDVFPISTNDDTVKILASYTGSANSPFALQKVVGKGIITYLYAEPYISAITHSTNDSAKAILTNFLGSLLKAISLPIDAFEAGNIKNDGATFRQVGLQGAIQIKSDSVLLPSDSPLFVSINSTNFHSSSFSDMLINNITTHGNISWLIDCQNATFVSGGPRSLFTSTN